MKLEEYKSGMYTKINNERAFILTKIDYKWEWQDCDTSKLLAEASRLIGELNIYTKLIPEIDIYSKMWQKLEAISSCKIEGIETTLEDVLKQEIEAKTEKQDDIEEIKNYIEAMNYGEEKIKEGTSLSTNLIRDMHKISMQGKRGADKNPGRLRNTQECIEESFKQNNDFVPSANTEIIECLTDFEKFIENDNYSIPELIKTAILHYQFESIRPFTAGNGNTGRLIVPLYLQTKGILEKPYLYLSTFFEKYKPVYLSKLAKVRTNSDIIGWIKYFLEAVIAVSNEQLTQIKKLIDLKEQTNKIIEDLPVKDINGGRIFETLYKTPITTRKKILEQSEMKPSTLNTIINCLLETNTLKELTGQGRNQIFAFEPYIEIFADR